MGASRSQVETIIKRATSDISHLQNILDKINVVEGDILDVSFLEDAFEAFLGAIYLDLGYDFTNEFVVKLINKYVDLNILLEDDNYKDILMRYTQFKKIPLPIYQNEQKDKTFYSKIFLSINGIPKLFGLGHGNIIKLAEQNAAKNALNKIDKNDLLTINHN